MGDPANRVRPITWTGERLRLLDQTKLPTEILEHEYRDYQSVAEAIRTMIVRGAPAIGASAAYGMVLGAFEFRDRPRDEFVTGMKQVADTLAETRPTAVNLFLGPEANAAGD